MSHHVSLTELAETIKTKRIELGMSVRGLGKITGIDNSTLIRLEQGKHFPKPENLVKLSAALKLPLADLYHLSGYEIPNELPSMIVYLRSKGELPVEAQDELVTYYRQLKKKHGAKGKSPKIKPEDLI